ncbi:MAG: hypothetical protein ACYCXN_00625 [Acidimicrobiales bacterium]
MLVQAAFARLRSGGVATRPGGAPIHSVLAARWATGARGAVRQGAQPGGVPVPGHSGQ